MGMFDTVIVKCALPDGREPEEDYQTKSLDCWLGTYEITSTGTLLEYEVVLGDWYTHDFFGTEIRDREEIGRVWKHYTYTGDIVFYTSVIPDGERYKPEYWFEYRATFENGLMVDIKREPPWELPK